MKTMSRFNQYGNYYDPVGSHNNQPAGYTYQPPATSASAFRSTAASSGYGSNYQGYGSNTYGNQQYGQQTNNSTDHAAAALSSLSNQDYSQTSSANRTSTSGQYDNSWNYGGGSSSNTYNNSGLALPNRSQSNTSPLYANTHSSSTFGRLSAPEQSQNSSNTFGGSSAYQSAQSSAAPSHRSHQTAQSQGQPPRPNSPLSAVQAQQSHGHQGAPSSSHQPSPQMVQAVRSAQQNASPQQSASAEQSPTTVDPSQVYDNRAELQRKAQIEAERRRKYEAEQAAKKAEEERIAAEKRKEEEEKQKVEREAALKKAEQERKKKAREEKRQSKSAATTLQQMATGGAGSSSPPPANEEEAEMRAMFKKMRDFNAKNPAMLAKLWEEERKSHVPGQSLQAAKATHTSASSSSAQRKSSGAAAASSPAQVGVRPFQKHGQGAKAAPLGKQQATQPAQPSTAQANTSLWPPHKKGQLAEATAKWLMSLPPNAGKIVSNETVLNVLNSNPSYVQLCESLEGLGLKFERSILARELLNAVPDDSKAQAPAKPATPLGRGNVAASQISGSSTSPDALKKRLEVKKQAYVSAASRFSTVNYEAPLSLSEAAREVNNMEPPANSYRSPYFTQSQTGGSDSRPPSRSQPPEIKSDVKPEEPPRPPADKEEAARKRTFGDLVDLTAEDSDDEGPPPKKIVQPSSGPANGVNTQQQKASNASLQQPVPFKQFMYPGAGANQSAMHAPPRPPPGYMTVAHAAGQDPQAAAQTTEQSPVIPQPPPKQRGPSAEQLQQSRTKGRMLVEPIMRDRVARKSTYDSRTIARDVLLATGRHPDMRGLNAHLSVMQRLLGQHGGEFDSEGRGNRSDLSTVKWDIIDPEEAPKEKKSETAEDADDEEEIAVRPPQPSAPKERTTVNYETPSSNSTAEQKKKSSRRGRPPRHSMPDADGYKRLTKGLGETNTPASASRHTPTSARPATPSSAPTKMSAPVGYAAFRHIDADGNVIKKKGRPFGWKKNLHSREALGLTPAKSHTPAKPLASRVKKEQPEQVEPRYEVYTCEWAGCKAELHNLDTLKKHIVHVHGSGGVEGAGGYECWWHGCEERTVKEWGKTAAEFGDLGKWIEHVDREHLQGIKWRLGDGPGGGVVGVSGE